MIRLSEGDNDVAVTLTEDSTLTVPIYLFEFIDNQTQVKHYCIAPDTSLYKYRYNLFNIKVVTSTPNPLNGEVNLLQGNEFAYNIYEQVSTTNLNPLNTTFVVEYGMMTFDRSIDTREEYVTLETTRKAYEPN